jgi:hypothetical protein
MSIKGVTIETIQPPTRYSYAQIEQALAIALMIDRGKLILCEEPAR